jgi:hypothetical protein
MNILAVVSIVVILQVGYIPVQTKRALVNKRKDGEAGAAYLGIMAWGQAARESLAMFESLIYFFDLLLEFWLLTNPWQAGRFGREVSSFL